MLGLRVVCKLSSRLTLIVITNYTNHLSSNQSAEHFSLNFKCFASNDHLMTVFVTVLKDDEVVIKMSVFQLLTRRLFVAE